jgi:peptidoglycan hydrolase-like amidase
MRKKMSRNRLLSKSLIGLTSGCILLYVALPVFVTLAAPLIQNPYSECPPNSNNIWVQLDDNNFDGQAATLNVPFDTGQTTINNNVYVNYLLGVLISEVGPTTDFNPVDDETLKAMAIAARTVAYKNCGIFSYGGHRGIDDRDKQVYDPRNRETWLNSPTLGQAELDRYQQAIDDTVGL